MTNSVFITIISTFFYLNTSCYTNKNILYNSSETATTESIEKGAFNQELLIPIGEDTIAGYALIADGETPKETIILIQGYPGNDTNFDIGQDIRNSGKNVILFNHRGAWGSQGSYSYSNCLNDVQAVINYLSKDKISNKLRIKREEFTLIGRSYGAGIALIKGSQMTNVKSIIAITSVNYGIIMKQYKSIDELGSYKKYMKRQIMMNHDIDHFLQELLNNKEAFNILNYSDQLTNKNVLFIEDSNKNEEWISHIEKAKYVVIESDHNFVNERSKLISTVLNWLENH